MGHFHSQKRPGAHLGRGKSLKWSLRNCTKNVHVACGFASMTFYESMKCQENRCKATLESSKSDEAPKNHKNLTSFPTFGMSWTPRIIIFWTPLWHHLIFIPCDGWNSQHCCICWLWLPKYSDNERNKHIQAHRSISKVHTHQGYIHRHLPRRART